MVNSSVFSGYRKPAVAALGKQSVPTPTAAPAVASPATAASLTVGKTNELGQKVDPIPALKPIENNNVFTSTGASGTSISAQPASTGSDLRDVYQNVFSQQQAQVNRQNALRSAAATRNAQEQSALAGYSPGSDQAMRLTERNAASANTANLEAQNDLLNQGATLAMQQRQDDDNTRMKLLQMYNETSPELSSAIAKDMIGGLSGDYANVFNSDGTVKVQGDIEKSGAEIYNTSYSVAKANGMSDDEARKYAEERKTATIQALSDTTFAEALSASSTANIGRIATDIRNGADISKYDTRQIAAALQADPELKTTIRKDLPDTSIGSNNSAFHTLKNAKTGDVLYLDGKLVRVESGLTYSHKDISNSLNPFNSATDEKNRFDITVTDLENNKTETKRVTYYA